MTLLFDDLPGYRLGIVAELAAVDGHTAAEHLLGIPVAVDPLAPVKIHQLTTALTDHSPTGRGVQGAIGVPAGALRMPPRLQRRAVAALDIAQTPTDLR